MNDLRFQQRPDALDRALPLPLADKLLRAAQFGKLMIGKRRPWSHAMLSRRSGGDATPLCEGWR